MVTVLQNRYLRALEGWPAAMRGNLYEIPGDLASACYGPGDHGHWALQANATAASAFAVLSADPACDTARAGMSRDEMRSWALRLIHFYLASHHVNGGVTTDGLPWGHAWISVLGLERLMHGIDALGANFPQEERDLLNRVLVSESDWLLDNYEIVAGLVQNNKPESNIWNGCLLYRTAQMVADTPRRDEYLEKATRFLLNGISTPSDAVSREIINGRPLANWHVGANMYGTMACNHHGYLNVGYMVICLSNIAMLHFACRTHGWQPPAGLYHHARELWQLVKTCTFPDGRLWRIGGDTRVRYCYCQDYAVPAWLLARDLFGDDDVETYENGWLDLLKIETDVNNDGTFLSTRLHQLKKASPLYYLRLEGDRAGTLSMGAYWHRLSLPKSAVKDTSSIPVLTEWSDEYHGSMLINGSRRKASWTWGAAKPPQGISLPADSSNMAEWQGNLGGKVIGMGYINDAVCHPDQNATFPGGFATCGRVTVNSQQFVAEGESPRNVADIDIACVALPDDRTMVVMQHAKTINRVWLREVKGLFLQIPNDIFNGLQRNYYHANGQTTLPGCPGKEENLPIPGDWLNIDDKLGIISLYGEKLCIYRPADRQITIKSSPYQPYAMMCGGNLYVDEICCGATADARGYDANTVLFDIGTVIMAGANSMETAAFMTAQNGCQLPVISQWNRAVSIIGADNFIYLVIANFGDIPTTESFEITGIKPEILTDGNIVAHEDGNLTVEIPARRVVVIKI